MTSATLVIVSFSLILIYSLRISRRPITVSTECTTVRSDIYMARGWTTMLFQRYRIVLVGRSKQIFFQIRWEHFHYIFFSMRFHKWRSSSFWMRLVGNKQIVRPVRREGIKINLSRPGSNIVVYADDNRALAVNAT